MKEQIHTIPISDAFENAGECPFCYIEKRTEDHVMDFVLGHGASYMEADIREMTDKEGFCRSHFKKMFDYGNTLGNAWILKTHYQKTIKDMKAAFKNTKPAKLSLGEKLSKTNEMKNATAIWADKRRCSCYNCEEFD